MEHNIEKEKYREQVKMNKGGQVGGGRENKGCVTRWSKVHPPFPAGAQAITHSRQQLVTEHLTTDLTNSRLDAGRDAGDHHTAEHCCGTGFEPWCPQFTCRHR